MVVRVKLVKCIKLGLVPGVKELRGPPSPSGQSQSKLFLSATIWSSLEPVLSWLDPRSLCP